MDAVGRQRRNHTNHLQNDGHSSPYVAVGIPSSTPSRHRAFTTKRVTKYVPLCICIFLFLCLIGFGASTLLLSNSSSQTLRVEAGQATATPAAQGADPTATGENFPSQFVVDGDGEEHNPETQTLASPVRYKPEQLNTRSMQLEGEYLPLASATFPNLNLFRRRYSSQQLHDLHTADTFMYTFVNGTEANHKFRKLLLNRCKDFILTEERLYYQAVMHASISADTTTTNILVNGTAAEQKSSPSYRELQPSTCVYTLSSKSGAALLESLDVIVRADNRDREADELRHSIRSIEKNIRWHRGRIVIVSPGHHPQWVDPAKNFLAGTCAGAKAASALRGNGRHLRVTTVHQDVVLPYGMRLTVNSHSIEPHLWRLKNLTPVHVYFNDDYFVNRPVAVTDFFNEYGGTIIRTEAGVLRDASAAVENETAWIKGVYNTQFFNILELDTHPEDYLPRDMIQTWATRGMIPQSEIKTNELNPPSPYEVIDIAHQYAPPPFPKGNLQPRKRRWFTTHAPFAYCTNMHRYFATRYDREFAYHGLHFRWRRAQDFLVPFLYNAFIMARPWVASPKFLPHLVRAKANFTGARPQTTIDLNNEDGCAPATVYAGIARNGCMFAKFIDDIQANQRVIDSVAVQNPLFFNINAGFSWESTTNQLRQFLHDKFPNPVYLEHGNADFDGVKVEADLTGLYRSLMQLPLVAVTSFAEGRCPLLRSLQLALPDHRGEVRAVVHRFGTGEVDPTLREARSDLRHRVYNAMPCVRCAYTGRVQAVEAARHATLQGMVRDALASTSHAAAVALPAQCKGEYAGLRVRAIVIDAETPKLPVVTPVELRTALSMPGQTLALEDFTVMHVGPDAEDVALVLSRRDADARGVEWIHGASEGDLLLTFPVPYAAYEDLSAPVTWL